MQVASFPSAASVFGTQESTTNTAASIFGFNPSGIPQPPVPVASIFGTSKPNDDKGTSSTVPQPPPPFSFGKLKLSFGESNGATTNKDSKPPAVFQFTSSSKDKDGGADSSSKQQSKPEGGSLFSIGVSDSSKSKPKPADTSSKSEDSKSSEKKLLQNSSILSSSSLSKMQALSPAVAECQRAIFAAFLWQENLVHDAMAAALHLKVHPNITKETRLDMTKKDQKEPKKEGGESPEDEREDAGTGEGDEEHPAQNLPPTINHLVTFWDEIAAQVISSSNVAFPPPKVPDLAQELQHMYDEEKKEMEKLKKEKNKKAGGGGGGTTICELCDQSFPDPVTYHMRESHPGCRKHASGWGYNSRGTFCSGWAGNCGDGGRGGSTWYLMCKDCHSKYLQQKEETKKKTPKQIVLPKMKCRKPGKPRTLRAISTVQGMILNAKFLLDVSSNTDSISSSTSKKISTPSLQQQQPVAVEDKSSSLPRKPPGEAQEAPIPVVHTKPPMFFRSMSMATQPKRIHSDSGDDVIDLPLPLTRQTTHEPTTVADKTPTESASGLMMKPSMALAKLMYQRSRKGLESKDTGYNRVLDFVQRYHDLEGLRVSMKQAMRIAVLRSFALEVHM